MKSARRGDLIKILCGEVVSGGFFLSSLFKTSCGPRKSKGVIRGGTTRTAGKGQTSGKECRKSINISGGDVTRNTAPHIDALFLKEGACGPQTNYRGGGGSRKKKSNGGHKEVVTDPWSTQKGRGKGQRPEKQHNVRRREGGEKEIL